MGIDYERLSAIQNLSSEDLCLFHNMTDLIPENLNVMPKCEADCGECDDYQTFEDCVSAIEMEIVERGI